MATERVAYELKIVGGLDQDAKRTAAAVRDVGDAADRTKREVHDMGESLDRAGKVGEKVGSLLGGVWADLADVGIDLAEKVGKLATGVGGLGGVAIGAAGGVGILTAGVALGAVALREFLDGAVAARDRLRDLNVEVATPNLDRYEQSTSRLGVAFDHLVVTLGEGGVASRMSTFLDSVTSGIEKLDRMASSVDNVDGKLNTAFAVGTLGGSLLVEGARSRIVSGATGFASGTGRNLYNELMYPTIDGVSGRDPRRQLPAQPYTGAVFGPSFDLQNWSVPTDTTYGTLPAYYHPPTAAEQAAAAAREREAAAAAARYRRELIASQSTIYAVSGRDAGMADVLGSMGSGLVGLGALGGMSSLGAAAADAAAAQAVPERVRRGPSTGVQALASAASGGGLGGVLGALGPWGAIAGAFATPDLAKNLTGAFDQGLDLIDALPDILVQVLGEFVPHVINSIDEIVAGAVEALIIGIPKGLAALLGFGGGAGNRARDAALAAQRLTAQHKVAKDTETALFQLAQQTGPGGTFWRNY